MKRKTFRSMVTQKKHFIFYVSYLTKCFKILDFKDFDLARVKNLKNFQQLGMINLFLV